MQANIPTAPKKFTVQLSKWRCGGNTGAYRLGEGETQLENLEGFACCLGFASKQLGPPGIEIICKAAPHLLNQTIAGLSIDEHSVRVPTAFSIGAMKINDDIYTTVEEKQELLIDLGKEHNIEINFIP